jgi:Xaa-Pro aminopeptidase
LLVLFGKTEGAGSEAYFVFHQESNFYYLTGFAEPGAILLLAPNSSRSGSPQSPAEILFLPARNPAEEIWGGPQLDPKDSSTAARLGFAAVREIGSLESELRRYARSYRTIYTLLPEAHGSEETQAAERSRVERLRKMVSSAELKDARPELAKHRQIKSAAELALIRRAVDCSIEAHLAAGRAVEPGMFEYQVAALMKYTFEKMGCANTAFHPLIGSGSRSVILHYMRNVGRLESGDVVVLDVGAEFGDYSADITRTLPVSGRFTPRQREIYEIVLGAQKAAIAAVRPGVRLTGREDGSLFRIAYDYLNAHGKDKNGEPLGKYFTHAVGHSVGLDVHDAEDRSAVLEPGMVLAIEPGLYLPEENIGVRIEDMVLVTETGSELLTARLPREVEDVERWMQEQNPR